MMDEKARRALIKLITEAENPALRDQILDRWADWQFHATEWDADKWGLPSSKAMKDDLACLRLRAKQDGSPIPEHWFVS
jgi:hypothetical protein